MSYNPFTLENKKILITGASSGIGRAISIECSRMGANLIITGRNKDRLQETFELLNEGDHIQIVADILYENEVSQIVDVVTELDGYVNCAGYVQTLPVQFINKDAIEKLLMVNTIAPILLLQKLLKQKKIKKGASVVYIASTSGLINAAPGNSMYSTSKSAICGFVKNAALDLAPKRIRVNTVCPATVETAILKDEIITEEQLNHDKLKYPLKRYGKPEEIAYAVIYLLSDTSLWVTGSNLVIDGGLSAT